MQTVFWQQMIPDLEVDYKQLNNALAVNYTGTACGCLLFIPFSIKYGRRPVYLISIAVMTALAFWTSRITSVTELYITNLLCGLSGSTNETLVQMTVRSPDPILVCLASREKLCSSYFPFITLADKIVFFF